MDARRKVQDEHLHALTPRKVKQFFSKYLLKKRKTKFKNYDNIFHETANNYR